jgi:hypothetical protein
MQKLPPAFVANMWKPGQAPNPYGKSGDRGRMVALKILDDILAEAGTKKRMKEALRAYINQRPVAAFKTLVMPRLPKNVRVDLAGERIVVSPTNSAATSTSTPAAAALPTAPPPASTTTA